MKRKAKRRAVFKEQTGNAVVKIYQRQKIYKRKDGQEVLYRLFEVEDKTGGVRRLRSFNDIADARKEAKKIADALSTGNALAAQMTNRQAASWGAATHTLAPTGASLEYAATVYAKIFELVGDRGIEAAKFFKVHRVDQIRPRTVAQVVTELLELKEARKKSDRYIKDLRNRLDRFAEDFNVEISSLTGPDVQRWIDKLDVAPQTAKNFRTVIRTLFGFAESRGYIIKGGNPIDSVEAITSNGSKIAIYTPEEMKKLLDAAQNDSKELIPALVLGAFAGLRTAEILRLSFEEIFKSQSHIEVAGEKAKTRSRRLVPILPNLTKWLAEYSSNKGPIWEGDEIEMSKARAVATAAAGVEWKDNGLRHSFISYRLADVQSAAQVALEAGNSPAVVFKHYRELVKPEQAKLWFAINPEANQ